MFVSNNSVYYDSKSMRSGRAFIRNTLENLCFVRFWKKINKFNFYTSTCINGFPLAIISQTTIKLIVSEPGGAKNLSTTVGNYW
jgi:hypothetical protein